MLAGAAEVVLHLYVNVPHRFGFGLFSGFFQGLFQFSFGILLQVFRTDLQWFGGGIDLYLHDVTGLFLPKGRQQRSQIWVIIGKLFLEVSRPDSCWPVAND